LSDPAYRCKISRQFNKGESLHTLMRDLLYAHEGMVRARHLEARTEQAWCLTLVTNSVVTWTTPQASVSLDLLRVSPAASAARAPGFWRRHGCGGVAATARVGGPGGSSGWARLAVVAR
jgi:hypothetical protein